MTGSLSFKHWIEPASFFRSFALSCLLARKNGGPIDLVTDSHGSHLLCDVMRLPYERVSLELQDFAGKYSSELWPLGKIKAYEVQTEPFIHLDGDLFLLSPLPASVLQNRVTFQSMEGVHLETSPGCYDLTRFVKDGAVLPPSWSWSMRSSGSRQYAVNMGFYACNEMAINRQYCEEVFAFLANPLNDHFLKTTELFPLGVALEQFTASAVCRMHGVLPKFLVREYVSSDWSNPFVHIFWTQKASIQHDEMIKTMLADLAPEYLSRAEQAAQEFVLSV